MFWQALRVIILASDKRQLLIRIAKRTHTT